MEANSIAYGINDNEQIVAYAYTNGDTAYHAFLHSGSGALIPLPTTSVHFRRNIQRFAYGINSGGQGRG